MKPVIQVICILKFVPKSLQKLLFYITDKDVRDKDIIYIVGAV